jgi:hypothetical protein
VFLHHGVKPAYALKPLQPHVDTPHALVEVLMEIMYVASYASHPTSWPCRVTLRLPRPRDEPSVQMGVLAPTTVFVARHLNVSAVGLYQHAYAHPGTCRPDTCTNCLSAGCFYRRMLRKSGWSRQGRLSAVHAPLDIADQRGTDSVSVFELLQKACTHAFEIAGVLQRGSMALKCTRCDPYCLLLPSTVGSIFW